MTSPAHSIYAEELFKLGHGYPLWFPDCRRETNGVMIGDIGYIDQGSFHRLFNATLDKSNPINALGVPEDFQVFAELGDVATVCTPDALPRGPLYSRTIMPIDFHSDTLTGRFSCSGGNGALLIVGSPATREQLTHIRRIKNYMFKNQAHWLDFAQDRGREVCAEGIIFVRGWVKTTRWAVAALTEGGENVELSFHGFEADAPFSATNYSSFYHHTGPRQETPQVDTVAADQCIFVHYCKLKRRRFIPNSWKLQAAAEPQDPPPSSDDETNGTQESQCTSSGWSDPVDYILEYIFQYTLAEAAIASDTDLSDLCKVGNLEQPQARHVTVTHANILQLANCPLPEDIPDFLRRMRPQIELTQEGVGMLSLDDSITDLKNNGVAGTTEKRDDGCLSSLCMIPSNKNLHLTVDPWTPHLSIAMSSLVSQSICIRSVPQDHVASLPPTLDSCGAVSQD
ncbi:uncharacterized protein FIBRA_02789 [Fibroporia radiculosa]|uniref:Uncharacterized protein n=1 Tax=Fibroporia radiculosa TaxID=599839 RepID=J4H218_9APHY|nr:uncharacterized protein FIBRA_02789 [Fibroporia radiculosa]CCM00749.1 predicted protein [Fibroporia radiculosa]